MKFVKGQRAWNKGKPRTWESNSFIKGGIPWNKGIKYLAISGLNHYKWKGGLPNCECGKQLKAYASKICKKCQGLNMRDEKNPSWKGDEASYESVHIWVRLRLGKALHCSKNINHASTRYHWANISGEYKRNINDWHELCPSCNFNDGIKKAERFNRRLIS